MVLRTTYNGSAFVGQNASVTDYTLFLTILILLMTTSFVITMGMRRVMNLND